jgi:acyl dehydratase
MSLYAEDIAIGAVLELGTHRVTKRELVEFASRWDPQDFHINDAAAQASRFGAVIASGVHTLAVFQRLSVLAAERQWRVIAGVELRTVRFLAPVRAGTELSGYLRIDDVVLDPTRGRGLVTKTGWLDDGDRRVIELVSDAYVRSRVT